MNEHLNRFNSESYNNWWYDEFKTTFSPDDFVFGKTPPEDFIYFTYTMNRNSAEHLTCPTCNAKVHLCKYEWISCQNCCKQIKKLRYLYRKNHYPLVKIKAWIFDYNEHTHKLVIRKIHHRNVLVMDILQKDCHVSNMNELLNICKQFLQSEIFI